MLPFINTIGRRLFFSFGILVINIIVVAVLALVFFWRSHELSSLRQEIDVQRITMVKLIKTDLDFLRFETVNSKFFATGASPLLEMHDSLTRAIDNRQLVLKKALADTDAQIVQQCHSIDSALTSYHATFRLLLGKINERGFKDFGKEGKMRVLAHELEHMQESVPLSDLLMLRRHEKDFFLRKEQRYIDQFNTLADEMIADAERSSATEVSKRLLQYKDFFNDLAVLHYEIGATPEEGLLGRLDQQTTVASNQLDHLASMANVRMERAVRRTAMVFSIVSIVFIVFSTLLTYYTSVGLARPIKKLSRSIGKFIVNEGLDEKELEAGTPTDEIGNLSQSFIKLSRQLKRQFSEIIKQNKELRKLNEELDRFIYSAAHDLKSPLASLNGLILLAEKEIASPMHGHYFSMMSESVQKLDGFLRDITDYAKNKRQHLRLERIDLALLLHEIVGSLRFLPDGNSIEVNIHVSGQPFFSDKTRLEIILKNLISNSFRYIDAQKQTRWITLEAVTSDEWLRFSIKDNGIGIEKAQIGKIFNMFYRGVEHSKGTGIGLFLVKESVKMLRGKIGVQSELGQWTVFKMILPNLKSGNVVNPESEEEVVVYGDAPAI